MNQKMKTAPAAENKMGTMPIGKLLFNMSLPMMISMLVQALYNIVDSIFVAKLSENALTAVSLAFPLQTLLIAVATGTGVGMNALLSKVLGERRSDEADKIAVNAAFIYFLSYLVFLILGFTIVKPFYASQIGTADAEIMEMGIDYLRTVMIFSFGLLSQIFFERLLTSTGRTIFSMTSQLCGAITNIILDPIFIFAFHMGVKGAALATILSQAISTIWVVRFLCGNKTQIHLRRKYMRLQPKVFLPCVALGLAAFIMQASESIVAVCFNSSLLRYGGDIAVGTMTILTSVMQFAMLPLQGIAQGSQPISSYNYGAKNADRVKKTFRLLVITCLTYSVIFWIIVQLIPKVFVSLFTSDGALVAFAAPMLRIYMGGMLLFGIQIACQMTFTSLGRAVNSIVVAVVRKFVLLIPLIYIIPHAVSNPTVGVYMAEPIADIIAVLFTSILFAFAFRKALAEI